MGRLIWQFLGMGQITTIGAEGEFLVCISFFAETRPNFNNGAISPQMGHFGTGGESSNMAKIVGAFG